MRSRMKHLSAAFGSLSLLLLTSMLMSSCLSWIWKDDSGDKEVVYKKDVIELIAKSEAGELELVKKYNCEAAKEYITAFNFLKEKKEFAIETPDARDVATKVAAGCTGAAKRFIQVVELLAASKLDGRNAILIATELARGTDEQTETFMLVFKKAFLRDYLDMNLRASIVLAQKLSLKFKGNQKLVQDSFERMAKFCISTNKLDLSRPQCGEIAARIAAYGENHKENIAKKYIEAVEYLMAKDKANIALFEAMRVAEQLVSISPYAVENFVKAFEYAQSKNGLKFDRKSAINFGRDIAGKTVQEAPVMIAH